MEYIIGFIVGAVVAWRITEWIHLGSLVMILKEFNITEDDIRKVLEKEGVDVGETTKASKVILAIKVEKHGEQFYAFEVDNDRFLGQGSTVEDLAKQILTKVPAGTEIQCDIKDGGRYFTLEAK